MFRPGAGSHDPDITAAELQGLVTVAVDRYRDLQSSTADRPHSGYQTGRYFPSARFSPGVVQQTVEPITALWEFLAFMPLDCMLRSDYRKTNPVDNIFFPGNFCWQFLDTKSVDCVGPQQIQVFIHDYLWIITDIWLTIVKILISITNICHAENQNTITNLFK